MKKRAWKEATRAAEARAYNLAIKVQQLEEQIADMQKKWRPIPIPHTWVPRNPACLYCDDPREAERHQAEG